MPASAELVATLRKNGLPAVISGAGPTVLVLARDAADADRARAFAPANWRVDEIAVLARGGHVVA
jgi:homoserine kinase